MKNALKWALVDYGFSLLLALAKYSSIVRCFKPFAEIFSFWRRSKILSMISLCVHFFALVPTIYKTSPNRYIALSKSNLLL